MKFPLDLGHFEALFLSVETVIDPKSELLCLCTVGIPQGFVLGPLKFSRIVWRNSPWIPVFQQLIF